MVQATVHTSTATLQAHRAALSDAIQDALVAALDYPREKRFQRFLGLAPEDFIHPPELGEQYTVVEISMFIGRTEEQKRALIREIQQRVEAGAGIPAASVEITVFETPRSSWGIRGMNDAEL